MFSNRVLLDSGCAWVVWTTWPLKRYWGGSTLFSLPLIGHAIRTGMHCRASVIDRPQSLIPKAVLGNKFTLGWSAQSLLSASKKYATLNTIVKHVSQTLNYKWDISAIWKRSKSHDKLQICIVHGWPWVMIDINRKINCSLFMKWGPVNVESYTCMHKAQYSQYVLFWWLFDFCKGVFSREREQFSKVANVEKWQSPTFVL